MTRPGFGASAIRSRRASYGLGAAGIGTFVVLAFLGDRTPASIATALLSVLAAFFVVLLVPTRPRAAFGVLLLLSSVSKVTIDVQAGNLRLEQPAIVAAIAAIVVSRSWPRASELKPVLAVVLAFAAYLAVLTLSSVLYAPEFATSARMIIWTAISMAGGAVAFTLLIRAQVSEIGWFTLTGLFHAVVGVGVAALFLVSGPDNIPGMQVSPGELPKVAALTWEANVFASLLAAMAPFALEQFRSRPSRLTALPAFVIVVGMGLGVTRGAYVGLAVSVLVYLGLLVARRIPPPMLKAVTAVIVVAFVIAPVAANVLLPLERPHPPSGSPSATGEPAKPSGPLGTLQPGSTRRPSPTPAPTATPTATSIPTVPVTPRPATDTLTFRLNRIPVAVADLERSPLIGLGAATFGQRHALPGRPDEPDYLGILALVTLYETGILGLVSLGGGLAIVLWLLFQASKRRAGLAAAYAASLVSLLVAYQATNAMFFSLNWLIIGAALAFVVRSRREAQDRS
jgi:hypothetical protein